MSRQSLGVAPHIAERVLGHAIPGIASIYDRHTYFDEKADALAKLAALIERTVNTPADNVVAMPQGRPPKATQRQSRSRMRR
jgi:hypothetical protein